MTEQETIKVVTLIIMSYPAADKFKDDNTVTAMVNVWSQMFKDDNPRLVELAVQKHIATSKWPPNIAEIREQMVLLEHPEIIPPDIAWAAVSDLIYGTSKYDVDAYKSLPPLIARCVEIIGWSDLCQMNNSYDGRKFGYDRMAFMDLYKPAYERARGRAMLPKALSDAISKTERILGGEAYAQLEVAHQKRVEQAELYNGVFNAGRAKMLAGSLAELGRQSLLGEITDE